MKAIVLILVALFFQASAYAGCAPWSPCKKGRISADEGYAAAVAASTASSGNVNLTSQEIGVWQQSTGRSGASSPGTAASGAWVPGTSTSHASRQGTSITSGALSATQQNASNSTRSNGLTVVDFGQVSEGEGAARNSFGKAGSREGESATGDRESGATVADGGAVNLANAGANAAGDSSNWRWTGLLVTGQAAEKLKALIFQRLQDGNFRSGGERVDFWLILEEAINHAKGNVPVGDALWDWKARYHLGSDDRTIWTVLNTAGLVLRVATNQ